MSEMIPYMRIHIPEYYFIVLTNDVRLKLKLVTKISKWSLRGLDYNENIFELVTKIAEWFWIDAILHDYIPFLALLIGNTFIVIRVSQSNHFRKIQQRAASGSSCKNMKGGKVNTVKSTCYDYPCGILQYVLRHTVNM
jgi:hypothetical protein